MLHENAKDQETVSLGARRREALRAHLAFVNSATSAMCQNQLFKTGRRALCSSRYVFRAGPRVTLASERELYQGGARKTLDERVVDASLSGQSPSTPRPEKTEGCVETSGIPVGYYAIIEKRLPVIALDAAFAVP